MRNAESPFYILKTEKGASGPNRHQEAHQIPLKNPKTDPEELKQLEEWLRSYNFAEVFDTEKGELK
jgi:xylulose-5-phosphate/fructose-6-phosphate phosphoketolase